MKKSREAPFIVDGRKSSIHCLYQSHQKSADIAPYRYHYHDYIELLYAPNADINAYINDENIKFVSGDFLVITSGEAHTFTFNSDSFYYCVKFSPEILYSQDGNGALFDYMFPFVSKRVSRRVFKKGDLEVDSGEIMEEIMEEWNSGKPASDLVIRSGILRLFSALVRSWEKEKVFKFSMNPTEPVKKALVYIFEKGGNVSEAEAAEACSLSPNYFSRAFKSAVGETFKEYTSVLKIRSAEKLMMTTDKSITEIAFETGFSSTSHFISSFKKYNDLTPKQFQTKMRRVQKK